MKLKERIIHKIGNLRDEDALVQLEKWLDALSGVDEKFSREEVDSVMEGYSQYERGEFLNQEDLDHPAEKIELAKMLLNTDNPRIIQSIREILIKEKSKDFWDEMTPAQQKEVQDASTEVEHGKTTDYETFISKHR